MRGGSPTVASWSLLVIDSDKDMLAYHLTNLGNVDLAAAHSFRTPNLAINEEDANTLRARNAINTEYRDWYFRQCYLETVNGRGNPTLLQAADVDGRSIDMEARDSGVGRVKVARAVGAVDPYFEATLPMVLKPGAVPGAPVEGHFWYDNASKKLNFRGAAATQAVAHNAYGSYVGDNTVNRAIAHNLGVLPKMVLIIRDAADPNDGQGTFHIIIGISRIFYTLAAGNNSLGVTAPTGTNFYVGNATNYAYTANGNLITYSWVAIG